MSNLSAFLHPEKAGEQEIIVSGRFKENGKVVKFKIRPITQEENDAIVKKCMIKVGDKTKMDTTRYTHYIVKQGTVYPDFSAKELCDAYDVADPTMVAPKMLYAGEFQRLADAIAKLSGIGDYAVEEAKN